MADYECVVVKVKPETKQKFDDVVKELDLTMSQVTRKLIEDFIKNPQKFLKY